MARKAKGKDDLVSMQEKALKGESELEQLRAMLAQKEKEQKALEQQIEMETIRSLGNEIQPFVVRFNNANLGLFEFLKDVCGAFDRGEAIMVSGKQYKASKENSFSFGASSESEE